MKFSFCDYYPTDEKLNELKKEFENIFSNLKGSIKNKKDLHDLILNDKRVLKTEDTKPNQKPEDYTKRIIVRPLLRILGYSDTDFGRETEQDLDISQRWADYELIIGNDSVLVEAEPLNKDLRSKNSGIAQVKEWILNKQTKTDFGIATDGFLWIMVKFDRNSMAIKELKLINLRAIFLEFIGQTLLEDDKDSTMKEFYSLFSKQSIISAFKEVTFKLEVYQEQISKKFYTQYMDFVFGINAKTGSLSRQYSLLKAVKRPVKNKDEDRLFAINFMNRIFFVKFLEDKGLVKKNLLKSLWDEFSKIRETLPNSFYKTFLQPLFFGVFNTPVKERLTSVEKIVHFKDIPYLNGGLFSECVERELDYDIEDDILEKIILEFIEKYNFILSGEEGLDPDILGNIFEKTINYIAKLGTNRQKALGAYYTPDDVTSYISKNTIYPTLIDTIRKEFIANGWRESELRNYIDLESFLINPPRNSSDVKKALKIIDKIIILDPACGSGHFLTTALKELVHIKESLLKSIRADYSVYHLKRDIIGRNLFGIDIEGAGVEIAKLRLWLSLIEDMDIADKDHLETLPNIDFNILKGDSLVGWINESLKQSGLSKPYDDSEIQNIIEFLKGDCKGDVKKLKIISKAAENFNNYKQDKILESYNLLCSIYSLESSERAIKLRLLLDKVRDSVYDTIGKSYAQYLERTLYPKKKKARHTKVLPKKLKDSFHWGIDFSQILKNGGFDVIIGNPPYIEKSNLKEYQLEVLKLYDTVDSGNTHAFFYERALTLLKKGGYCGLIVPISAVSTDRMRGLQELLINSSSQLVISNYDDRPGKIFKDLEHCRSSIIISEKRTSVSDSRQIFTTTYNRWYTKDREKLFSNLNYVNSTNFVIKGAIPKVGEEIEKSILNKIYKNTPLKQYLNNTGSNGKLWFHNAPQYWIRALDFIPFFWNQREGNKISDQMVEILIKPSKYNKIVTAILNSSLFYWFFILYSDGRHLNLREVENFPIDLNKIDTTVFDELKNINQELMKDYKKNSNRKQCKYETTGIVKYDEFFPGKSKRIIDKIDDLLSQHYGLSKKECSYIKEFSLTFRMGNITS